MCVELLTLFPYPFNVYGACSNKHSFSIVWFGSLFFFGCSLAIIIVSSLKLSSHISISEFCEIL